MPTSFLGSHLGKWTLMFMSVKNKQNSSVYFLVRALYLIHPRWRWRQNNAKHYKHSDITGMHNYLLVRQRILCFAGSCPDIGQWWAVLASTFFILCTAMFLYSKYAVFNVFFNCCGGRHVRVLGEVTQRRTPWAEPWFWVLSVCLSVLPSAGLL